MGGIFVNVVSEGMFVFTEQRRVGGPCASRGADNSFKIVGWGGGQQVDLGRLGGMKTEKNSK